MTEPFASAIRVRLGDLATLNARSQTLIFIKKNWRFPYKGELNKIYKSISLGASSRTSHFH